MLLDRFYGMLRRIRSEILNKRDELSPEETVEKYPTADAIVSIHVMCYDESTNTSYTIQDVKNEADRMVILIETIKSETEPA